MPTPSNRDATVDDKDLAARLIRELKLVPHPEGGFYRETWRDPLRVTRPDGASRDASTGIYYMLCADSYSAWHRIQANEAWHFYAGTPIDVHVLSGRDTVITHRLGNPLQYSEAQFQVVVPAGHWFAAERVAGAHRFALAGCTVAPGFEFSEFELADAAALVREYPSHRALIERLAPR
ncbi:MAG: cupin domain-containing protein [Cupriavidus sp.]|nr:MAG: cupin domain-containing protein [Cupriavidus sp.]